MADLVGPRLYSCYNCQNHVSFHDDIISKAFLVRCGQAFGQAFLFSHAMNITVGPKEDRQLLTGLYTVADVYCCDCRAILGWKYERAYEETHKYKEGKFILYESKIVMENDYIEMSRKDPAWRYGKEVETPKGTTYKYIQCNFCSKVINGGVFRMKEHLAGVHGNAAPCDQVPDNVKDEIKKYMKALDGKKKIAQRIREERINEGIDYNTQTHPTQGHPSTAIVSQRGVRGEIDRYFATVGDDVLGEGANIGKEGGAMELRRRVCVDIGRCMFENGIPFNVANSHSFTNMLRSVGNYGRGLKPPTSYELSTWVLKEEKKNTELVVDEIKRTWAQTGVTLMSDGWKDMRGRQLINFLVNNLYGTVFLRSIDASDQIKDTKMLFKLLDDVIEEIGENIVIQVVTDNASNYKAAGKLLMEKRTRLWWTPCAAHCIDLMLEKIGELPQHRSALMKGKKVSNFIYNHGSVLAMMRTFTKNELIRPAAMRFATAYLTLQSIFSLKQPLEQMFTSKEWNDCSWSKKGEGKAIKKIILRDPTFWSSVSYALKTTRPLVSVLRMTNSEKVPGMGFIYGVMDKAKEEIANNLGGEVSAYKEIWKIIDDKWEFQLHRHLHAAAYFLNPQFQYSDTFSSHPEVKLGLLICMEKLIPNEAERVQADLQVDHFRNKRGMFGFAQAKSTIYHRSPADWWIQFGDQTPELQSFAVRILSLTCSSSGCERNWSTFNTIHTKKRNHLSMAKLETLAHIMYNKRLKDRFLKKKALKDDDDPLILDYVPSDDEWLVNEDDDGYHSTEETDDMHVSVDTSRPSGSRQARQTKKEKTNKGKAVICEVDEESEWEGSETGDEDDKGVRYGDSSPDDDDDGGDDSLNIDTPVANSLDPHFHPLDTNDSLYHIDD